MSEKVLAFDALALQPTAFSPFHGGGKYGKVILRELVKENEKILLIYSSFLYCDDLIQIKKQYSNIELFDIDRLKYELLFADYDIAAFYFPIPFSKLYKKIEKAIPQTIPIIATIHGLRDLECQINLETFKYRTSLKQNVRRVMELFFKPLKKYTWKKLICRKNYNYFVVSNHTRNAVRKILPNEDPLVFYSPSVVRKKTNIVYEKKRYFLLVSGNRYEKNNLIVMRVLDKLISENEKLKGFSVKITGVKSLNDYIVYLKNPSKFECLGYVDEDEFPRLYGEAFAFLYPSISEGFGYPLLEAMSAGTVIAASKLTSIPEVGGDAAIYFNPYSEKEISEAIISFFDSDCYMKLKENGNKQFLKIKKRQDEDLKNAVLYISSFMAK